MPLSRPPVPLAGPAEAPAPERALHRATEVFEKQFNILSDAAETSPLLAVCAAGVLFGVADSLWRGTSVLRALTEGAHLVTGGLLMQNFIKAAALSHLFERVSVGCTTKKNGWWGGASRPPAVLYARLSLGRGIAVRTVL